MIFPALNLHLLRAFAKFDATRGFGSPYLLIHRRPSFFVSESASSIPPLAEDVWPALSRFFVSPTAAGGGSVDPQGRHMWNGYHVGFIGLKKQKSWNKTKSCFWSEMDITWKIMKSFWLHILPIFDSKFGRAFPIVGVGACCKICYLDVAPGIPWLINHSNP